MNALNEFDQRQLQVMLEVIHRFELNEVSLSSLINNLEALLDLLNFEDVIWKEAFIDNWENLEIIYASVLDENKALLDKEDEEIINDSVTNIKKLINKKIKNQDISK